MVQRDGPYSLGRGSSGLGYEGLGPGLAVEFDTQHDEGFARAKNAHIAVRFALDPGAKLSATHSPDAKDYAAEQKVADVPDVEKLAGPVTTRVSYDPESQRVLVEVGYRDPAKNNKHTWLLVARSRVGQLPSVGGPYWVGFTAATGKSSFARFAVHSWEFGAVAHQGCMPGFTGDDCSVTNEEAHRECPRVESCGACVGHVYNCVWCGSGRRKGGECVVGTVESVAACSDVSYEPGTCGGSLFWVGVWIVVGLTVVVGAFAFVLVRILPTVQAFRAVSLLVSLTLGTLGGMFLSYVIAASLVEISVTPAFSLLFGGFFLVEGLVVGVQVATQRTPGACLGRAATDVALGAASLWVTASGVLCFALDRTLVPWLPEAVKVVFYMVLAAALNFCVVFSAVDVVNEVWERLTRRKSTTPGIAELVDSRARRDVWSTSGAYAPVPTTEMHASIPGGADLGDDAAPGRAPIPPLSSQRLLTVARSKAKVALLLVSSLAMGLYFGLVFGLMRVGDQDPYHAVLAVRREAVYTFPAGAFVGGVSGLLLQLVELPLANDSEIERMVHGARDDL